MSIEKAKQHAVDRDESEEIAPGIWPFQIGQCYLIQLVTTYWSGRVIAGDDKWLLLEDAAWVAETGRYTQALASGSFSEVEIVPSGVAKIIARHAICDATPIATLPREQK
jgi:hypothetical protein